MNNNHVFPILTLHFAITISFFLIVVPVSHCHDDYKLLNCSNFYPYRCGSSELNLWYPFWGGDRPQYCGREGFEIKCHDDHQYHFIEFTRQKFRVLSINYISSHPTMTIARDDLWNNYCPGNETQDTVMLDLEPYLFKYGPSVIILSFFHCQEIQPQNPDYFNFNCSAEGEDITGFYTVSDSDFPPPNLPDTCQVGIKVPVLWYALHGTENLGDVVNEGFEVEYLVNNTLCIACYSSHGICGSNQSAPGQFLCYCRDYDSNSICSPTGLGDTKDKNEEVEEDEDKLIRSEKFWLYVGMALGFIVGFWAVCGTLIIKRSWRHAYFGLVEETKDKLHVFIAVHMARFKRKVARQMLEDTNVPQRE